MRPFVIAALLFPAALPIPGQSAAEQRGLAEEMRSVRAAIERLEKGQTALLLLLRIQIDESRLAALEAERLQLLARQRALEKEHASVTRARSAASVGAGPTVLTADGSIVEARQTQDSAEQPEEMARSLASVSQQRRRVEEAIRLLRERITLWESRLDPSLR